MSTADTLRDLLGETFALDVNKIKPDTKLSELGIDSFSLLDFEFLVEQHFDITIPASAGLQDATVDQFTRVVEAAISRGGPETRG